MATAVAAVLVFVGLGSKSLWRDEAASYVIAAMPWRAFVDDALSENHNASLFYLLLRPMLALGRDEWMLRLLPALSFVATVPLVGLLAHRLLGPRQAVAAALLTAVNPFLLAYGQEARGYAPLVALSVAATWFLDVAATERRRSGWIGYGVTAGLAIYLHLFTAFFVAAQLLSLTPRRRLPRLREVAPGAVTLVLLWLPAVVLVVARSDERVYYRRRPPLSQPLRTAVEFAGSVPLFVVVGALVAVALWSCWRKRHELRTDDEVWRRFMLGTAMIAPVAVAWLVSYAVPMYESRYLIMCLPPMALLAADGISGLTGRTTRMLALAAVVALATIPIARYHLASFKREDIRSAVEYVDIAGTSDDAVAFMPAHARLGFRYYRAVDRRGDVPTDVARLAAGDPALWQRERPPAQLRRVLARHEVLWLVNYPGDRWHPSPPVMEQVFADCVRDGFVRTAERSFGEMHVTRYVRGPAADTACG